MQDVPGLGKNYIRYEYDLYSGNVTKVCYNEGTKEQFYHRYTYDSDNRILVTETSKDGRLWDKDANYDYYAYGPLKRAQIGEDKLQGQDYVYTIHGWLKGINHPDRTTANDPGEDGGGGSDFAQDAFGMILGYYEDDFTRTGSAFRSNSGSGHLFASNGLYNGNITAWETHIQPSGVGGKDYETQTGFTYRYDELNRLIEADFRNYSTGWNNPSSNLYDAFYSYDANGNILTLDRYNGSSKIDELGYNYQGGGTNSNRLDYVTDVAGLVGTGDLASGQATGNYLYDAIGNLIGDVSEGLTITWNVYGKVATVANSITSTDITFVYDAMGNRVGKIVEDASNTTTTWYVRDASGNILANYEQVDDDPQQLTEITLYGSDRLGLYRANISRDLSAFTGNTYTRELNKREYELKDHLGNVRVVVADRKLPASTSSPSDFTAVLEMYANYYPFGMVMEDRQYMSPDYRYGFNGMEKDDEVKGGGNSYDFGARIYDPRVGRFLSIDPRYEVFPYWSPYLFAGNDPVNFVDSNGEGPFPSIRAFLHVFEKFNNAVENYHRSEGFNDFYNDIGQPGDSESKRKKDSQVRVFKTTGAKSYRVLNNKATIRLTNGKKIKVEITFIHSRLSEAYNEVHYIDPIGSMGVAATGETGHYIYFRGKNNRLLGTMNFESDQDMMDYLATFKDDKNSGYEEAAIQYDEQHKTGGYYQKFLNKRKSSEKNAEVQEIIPEGIKED